MTSDSDLARTFADVCVLYELALACGTSLDLADTCKHFLSTLSARRGLSFCGVWLRTDRLPRPPPAAAIVTASLVYANPRSRIAARELSLDHPAWQRAAAGPFSAMATPAFASITVGEGPFAVFPLGDFGLLTLHARRRAEPFAPIELSQLGTVVESFAAAVDRCVTHSRLIAEIAERERIEREHQAIQAQLQQANKLEAVGRLAGGIAHDFNNLLMSILSTVELIQLEVDDPQMIEDLDDVATAGRRAAELTHQLLTFARPTEATIDSVDLDALVLEVTKLLRRTFDRSVEIHTQVGLDGATINGTAALLHTVLMNLAINARDAMPEGGRLRIETAFASDQRAVLRVADNGQGMNETTRARIFDPFFTTKGRSHGTGLGLATVYGIVKGHKGDIRVDSVPGSGTTFELLLPLTTRRARPELERGRDRRSAPALPVGEGRGHVLLVDSGRGAVPAALAELERLGYTVDLERCGPNAIETANRTVTLFVTVVGLAEHGPSELRFLAQLRASQPTMPVVLLSAPGDEAQTRRLAALGMQTVLREPIDALSFEAATAAARLAALRSWTR